MDAARSSPAQPLGTLSELARPVSIAAEQVLAVLPALESILPNGCLQRGLTVTVQGRAGASSLALALAVAASQAGSWVAAAGIPALGVASAAEMGLVLERLVLINPVPAGLWPTVAAALVDSFDMVLVGWPEVSGAMARRLGMRARDRRTVLVPVASGDGENAWNEAADIRLTVDGAGWEGLGRGHGRLTARRLEIRTGGRRCPVPRRTSLWLPDGHGRVAAAAAETLAFPGRALPAG